MKEKEQKMWKKKKEGKMRRHFFPLVGSTIGFPFASPVWNAQQQPVNFY